MGFLYVWCGKKVQSFTLISLKLSKIKFDIFLKSGYEIIKLKENMRQSWVHRHIFLLHTISFVATHNTSLTKKKKYKS